MESERRLGARITSRPLVNTRKSWFTDQHSLFLSDHWRDGLSSMLRNHPEELATPNEDVNDMKWQEQE